MGIVHRRPLSNGYLNNTSGAYITRENELTQGVASSKVYAQMQIPSGTRLQLLASNNGGATWETMTIEETRPVDEAWTEYTLTRTFTNPAGRRVRYKAVMTGTPLAFPRIHSFIGSVPIFPFLLRRKRLPFFFVGPEIVDDEFFPVFLRQWKKPVV